MNALITGASSGIGEAIAELFSKMNINLFLTARNEERLSKVSGRCQNNNVEVYYATGDVRSSQECNKIFSSAIGKLGKLDILIANAGVGHFDFFENFTDQQYDATFDTNVRGVFNYLRLAIPHMKEKNSGQIIIISSISALETYKRGGLYCASKYAIQSMAETLRKELSETRVKVATINPGSVDTPWFDKQMNFDNDRRKTMLHPSDVAEAAKFIIEQKSSSNVDKIVLKY